jgi:hypothetical protein
MEEECSATSLAVQYNTNGDFRALVVLAGLPALAIASMVDGILMLTSQTYCRRCAQDDE